MPLVGVLIQQCEFDSCWLQNNLVEFFLNKITKINEKESEIGPFKKRGKGLSWKEQFVWNDVSLSWPLLGTTSCTQQQQQ